MYGKITVKANTRHTPSLWFVRQLPSLRLAQYAFYYALDAAYKQLDGDRRYHRAQYERRDILVAPVPERVVVVGGARRQPHGIRQTFGLHGIRQAFGLHGNRRAFGLRNLRLISCFFAFQYFPQTKKQGNTHRLAFSVIYREEKG